MHEAARLRARDLRRRGVLSVRYSVISGVKSVLAGKAATMRSRYAARLRDRGDRRLEVGHDDGARELPRAVGQHRRERGAVAQMQMPVVGAQQVDEVSDEVGAHGADYRRAARAAT